LQENTHENKLTKKNSAMNAGQTRSGVFKSGYVAIIGQPNVGKSTLINRLLDFKVSSVTRKPQTTRHQIKGILNGHDHQVIFLDTPGLLEPRYKLHEAMLQAVNRALSDADIVLFMVVAGSTPDEIDIARLSEFSKQHDSIILLINKIDRISKEQILPLIEYYDRSFQLKSIIPVSALKNSGLDILKKEVISLLPAGLPFYDPEQVVDHPERFLVSEIIREKIFEMFGDEIPYATTVNIDEFTERTDRKDLVRATIYVEKNSQKGILIGKKGTAMQRIGKTARLELEELLGRPLFLELRVKVKEKWRRDANTLKKLGYF
jgi:GTP-binding protein Era